MVLYGLVSAITTFVRVRSTQDKEVIDTSMFRLHYKATCCILFLSCILCTATTLIGEPIACISELDSKLEKPLNTFCWITSTFSLPDSLDKPEDEVAYPGLGPHIPNQRRTYHTYYQWVPFALLFQGILFYLPHWLWKAMEQKRIHSISSDLRGIRVDKNSTKKAVEQLADYLVETQQCNVIYGIGYLFCEVLNLINVVGNVFIIDKFLGGVFLDYGTDVISFISTDQKDRTDPMIKIFPRLTKCNYRSYGSSGTIQTHDLICVMAINVINEKIYIFLWFWLFLLCGMTILAVLYIIIIMASTDFRVLVLRKRFLGRPQAEFLARKLSVGDFMLLNFLGYNISSGLFDMLLQKMCDRLNYPASEKLLA